LLSGYFGLGIERVELNNATRPGATNLQTPDFYNGRVNNSTGKMSKHHEAAKLGRDMPGWDLFVVCSFMVCGLWFVVVGSDYLLIFISLTLLSNRSL
jgi:hypothetical protein